MKNLTTFDAIITEADKLQLYEKLVRQLNKDLSLANIDLEFHDTVQPTSLKLLLHETLFSLIQEKFVKYLNLLYIVDVSEEKIRELDGIDVLKLSENVTFLILKREWQKVYFRSQYSQK